MVMLNFIAIERKSEWCFWTRYYIYVMERVIWIWHWCFYISVHVLAQLRSLLSLQVSLGIQLFHHLFSAVLIGGIFLQAGDDAKRPFTNVKFCLSVLVFFLYTHVMTPVHICE